MKVELGRRKESHVMNVATRRSKSSRTRSACWRHLVPSEFCFEQLQRVKDVNALYVTEKHIDR
jgi:hypothetical protein